MAGAPLTRKRQRPRDPQDVCRIKVLTLGDANVGKTAMIRRFCEGQQLDPGYRPTVGVDYFQKPMRHNDREVRLNVWDTSGSTEFFDVRSEFYKESHVALLVMDLSSRKSFDNLDSMWLREAQKCSNADLGYVVVGAKADLRAQRAVGEKQAKEWASQKGFAYFEVSAADGKGLDELWAHVVQKMM